MKRCLALSSPRKIADNVQVHVAFDFYNPLRCFRRNKNFVDEWRADTLRHAIGKLSTRFWFVSGEKRFSAMPHDIKSSHHHRKFAILWRETL